MTENILGKLLPNMTIVLNSDSDDVEDGEISENFETPDSNTSVRQSEKAQNTVDIVRTWMDTIQTTPKVFENKKGAFVTGLDLSAGVLLKKMEDRAERFGLPHFSEGVTQEQIDDLYRSLGIDSEDLLMSKVKNIRLNAIHMRGVNEMNTSDVFAYFGDYGPSSVEWINDLSCNIVWLDNVTTARALLGKSFPYVEKKNEDGEISDDENAIAIGESTSAAIGTSESEDSDSKDDRRATGRAIANSMEIDTFDKSSNALNEWKNCTSEDSASVDVPVPPGYWRRGYPHRKAKILLLRFATKDDRKLPGAEKRSQYYQKYGNPNYGGLKGLISKSKKRKIQADKNRESIQDIDPTFCTSDEFKYSSSSDAKRDKRPRMRMYADDESNSKSTSQRSERELRSVHKRLGAKYTKDDLRQLGRKFSSDSEGEEDDNVSINCTVPSRNNIWTDIARSMAKEDKSRSVMSRYRNFYDRSSPRHHRRFDSSRLSNERDTTSKRIPYSSWTGKSRHVSPVRSRVSPINKHVSALKRHVSPVNKHVSPLNRDAIPYFADFPEKSGDLRSKIKKLKSFSSVNQHRSPLCKDD